MASDKTFHYKITNTWTGNLGSGTSEYKAFSRDHTLHSESKPDILASSDPAFRGDEKRWSPEDMLVASLSGCHMLWYLHLCAEAKVVVTKYVDTCEGLMTVHPGGAGAFQSVTLRPEVTIVDASMKEKAMNLHQEAHKKCFIANSVNFSVSIEAKIFTTS